MEYQSGQYSVEDTKEDIQHFKSIVYGDPIKNKFGAFRCFCATVSHESQVEGIVNYLKKNPVFQRLKRFSHAYRINVNLEGMDVIVEDCKNDERLEGCGEKILHLLQKFNVENVLLIMGIDRKDNYSILNPEYYHIIIERAKDLLSTLYEKVIENEVHKKAGKPEESDHSDIRYDEKNRKYELQPKTQLIDFGNVPQHQPMKKKKTAERPNYFLNSNQREQQKVIVPMEDGEKERITENFLRHNLERNHEKIETILENWNDNDFQYLKFMCLYDRNTKVEKVFKILMILEDIKNLQDLAQHYDFKVRLPLVKNTFVGKEKCKKITDMLRIDKYLNSKILMTENHVIAALLDYLILIVRNYEISQKILEATYKKDPRQNSPSQFDKTKSTHADRRRSGGTDDDGLAINVRMNNKQSSSMNGDQKQRSENEELENQIKDKLNQRKTMNNDDSQPKIGSGTSEPNSKTGSIVQSKQDLLHSPSRGTKPGKSNRSSQGSISQEEDVPVSPTQKDRWGEDIPYDPEEIKQYLEENPIEHQPSENLEIIAERLKDHRFKNE
jgi:hypothetical protein